MSLIQPKTTEEAILNLLAKGPMGTVDLLSAVAKRLRITKQAFYAGLRKLKAEEVIVVYKGTASLNTVWVSRMGDWVDMARAAYLSNLSASSIFGLKERESVSYTFADTKHLDAFWGHSQSILVNETPATEPVYSFDPHYWFYIAREETERDLVDSVVAKGKQFLMTVGGSDPLDRAIRSDFSDDSRQYHIEDVFGRDDYYIVVIGNYITEVVLDAKLVGEIKKLYASQAELTEAVVADFKKLLLVPARHKLKISRNSRRARAIKTRLARNFFITQGGPV
jgi:hypothetical protein